MSTSKKTILRCQIPISDKIWGCRCAGFCHTMRSGNPSSLSHEWVSVAIGSSCWPQLDAPTCSVWRGPSVDSPLGWDLPNLWFWLTCCVSQDNSASLRSVTENYWSRRDLEGETGRSSILTDGASSHIEDLVWASGSGNVTSNCIYIYCRFEHIHMYCICINTCRYLFRLLPLAKVQEVQLNMNFRWISNFMIGIHCGTSET